MAVLSDAERTAIWSQWMRDNTIACSLIKSELRAAVDAIDTWANDNVSNFNQAIPQPARGALSARQKAWLLFHVIRRRYELT